MVGAVAIATACRILEAVWNTVMPYESVLLSRLRTSLAEIPEVVELSLFGTTSEGEVDDGLMSTIWSDWA